MTRQEYFNQAYRGLKAQRFMRSVNDDGKCLYRGPNGLKCAIGHLIPDDKYNSTCEGAGAQSPRIASMAGYGQVDKFFMEEMQEVHDNAESSVQLEYRLGRFAERWSLAVPND